MTKITQGQGGIRSKHFGTWLRIEDLATLTFEGHFKRWHLKKLCIRLSDDSIPLRLTAPQVRRLRDWLTDWLERWEERKP